MRFNIRVQSIVSILPMTYHQLEDLGYYTQIHIRCKSEQVDSKMETNCFIIHPFHTYGRQISAYRKFPHIKKGT